MVMEAREMDKTKGMGEVLSPGQMSRELKKSPDQTPERSPR
jgi:hypothetical protein